MPGPDATIHGLKAILDQFEATRPGDHNTAEWAKIREGIVESSYLPDVPRFQAFVALLLTIKPMYDNIAEWDAIKQTCSEIQALWDGTDPKDLFRMLLQRFSTTIPIRDNQVEWAAIRDVSNAILQADAGRAGGLVPERH